MGTQGPWVLGGCSGRMVTTPDGYVGDGFIADVDTLANAKLISAAPELLEALQSALSAMNEMGDILNFHDLADEKTVSKLTPVFDTARAAINKALGKE